MRRVQVIVSRKRALAIILALAAVIGGIAAWLAFQPTRFADGTPVWTSTIVDGAAGSPPPRLGPTAGYDASSNRMMVFGGAAYNDVWVLSNANGLGGTSVWTNTVAQGAAGSPPPRSIHTAVYDAASNRMMVFGGLGSSIYNDVWVLSNANGLGGTSVWTNTVAQGAAGSPIGRYAHTSVYDASGNRMIVFGGSDDTTYYNDVWVLSNANGLGGTSVWANTVAQGAGMSSPWRGGHSAVYDAASNRMVMFGGYNGTTYYNDVWVLSNANGLGGTPGWTNTVAQGAAGSPLGRVQPAAVYDASGKRMILFGGDIFTTYYNDVWVLSNANATP